MDETYHPQPTPQEQHPAPLAIATAEEQQLSKHIRKDEFDELDEDVLTDSNNDNNNDSEFDDLYDGDDVDDDGNDEHDPSPRIPVNYDPKEPLLPAPGEPSRVNTAMFDYYQLGSGRSMPALTRIYRKRAKDPLQKSPPTTSLRTLKKWSTRWRWQERVAAADLIDNVEFRREWKERRMTIVSAYYKKVAEAILSTDVQGADLGKLARAVQVLMVQLRAETTESIPDVVMNLDLTQLTDEQLERLSRGENALAVLNTTTDNAITG